jgi:uncharacterized protein YcfJ
MASRSLLACLLAACVAAPALGSDLIVYKEGVSDEQKQKDEFECHQFAVKETGFDPMNPPQAKTPEVAAPPATEPTQGGAVRGAARGAAVGAVVGAVAGDAGKGAAAGAAGGALAGGMRRRDARRQAQAQTEQAQQQVQAAAQQQQAEIQAQRDRYNRAVAACLQGRGYSVN